MNKYIDSAKKVLSKHTYLHYTDILKISLEEGLLYSEGKTPIDTLNSIIGADINNKGLDSIFLRVGPGFYALRDVEEEENLLIYVKYRLKDTEIWIVDDKDKKYCDSIFGKDIFDNDKEYLLLLLERLQKQSKIESYTNILPDGGILVKITEKQEEFLGKKNKIESKESKDAQTNAYSIELHEKIGVFEAEAKKFKKISYDLTENSGLKELASTSNKITEIFLSLLPLVSFNSKIIPDDNTLKQIEDTNKALQSTLNDTILKQLTPVIENIVTTLDSYNLKDLSKDKLVEFNEVKAQMGFFKSILNPDDFLLNLTKLNQLPPVINPKKITGGFKLPASLPISSTKDSSPTHIFEGYIGHKGDLQIIRGSAKIKDLERISKPKYYDSTTQTGQQRALDEKRAEKIKDYIRHSNTKFFPEVIIGLHLRDNKAVYINNLLEKEVKIDNFGATKKVSIEQININLDLLDNDQITRIDGNHRLSLSSTLDDSNDIFVSYCFIVFEERLEKIGVESVEIAKQQNEERESRLFYVLNNTAVKVSSEHALQIIFNIDKAERANLYGNDEVLRRSGICMRKYYKLKEVNQSMAAEYGENPHSKIEVIMKYIEKYESIHSIIFTDQQIEEISDIIQKSIQNIGTEFKEVKDREDYLFLVLNIYFDYKENGTIELQKIINDFCLWIIEKGFVKIIYSSEPVLWEVYKAERALTETSKIHSYQINENARYGKSDEQIYKEFIRYINESRERIICSDIVEKRSGLEKIVDAYEKLLDILGNGGLDNATKIENLIKRFFHSPGKENLKKYLKDDFYDNLGKRVMNNDFAIRHHTGGQEVIDDIVFIEFLYGEYDNAIRFILDKAGFLITH